MTSLSPSLMGISRLRTDKRYRGAVCPERLVTGDHRSTRTSCQDGPLVIQKKHHNVARVAPKIIHRLGLLAFSNLSPKASSTHHCHSPHCTQKSNGKKHFCPAPRNRPDNLRWRPESPFADSNQPVSRIYGYVKSRVGGRKPFQGQLFRPSYGIDGIHDGQDVVQSMGSKRLSRPRESNWVVKSGRGSRESGTRRVVSRVGEINKPSTGTHRVDGVFPCLSPLK